MLRGVIAGRGLVATVRHGIETQAKRHHEVGGRAWVGCSHWTTPFRPVRYFASSPNQTKAARNDLASTIQDDGEIRKDIPTRSDSDQTELQDFESTDEGIIVDHVVLDAYEPSSNSSGPSNQPSSPPLDPYIDRDKSSTSNRATLPTSIKKLNRLLSHARSTTIPESDLIERFVKGRGPGGQAINKTNSSVSLIHIPSGIRVQSQPTRSREENRKIARKIMAERLDLIRARAGVGSITMGERSGPGKTGEVEGDAEERGRVDEVPNIQTRKEKEKELAVQWSRDEIRWEKERRRKLNKAKKTKKKRKTSEEGGDGVGVA